MVKLSKRKVLVLSIVSASLATILFALLLLHNHTTQNYATTSATSPVQKTNTSRYSPVMQKLGMEYLDENHLIGHTLVSVNSGYIDPKLQLSKNCPGYQQQQNQSSYVPQSINCTVTAKLLTWRFRNTSSQQVVVNPVQIMFECNKSNLPITQPSATPTFVDNAGFPFTYNQLYDGTYTGDPAFVLFTRDSSGTQQKVTYAPGETKTVLTEVGTNCTSVGQDPIFNYEYWAL